MFSKAYLPAELTARRRTYTATSRAALEWSLIGVLIGNITALVPPCPLVPRFLQRRFLAKEGPVPAPHAAPLVLKAGGVQLGGVGPRLVPVLFPAFLPTRLHTASPYLCFHGRTPFHRRLKCYRPDPSVALIHPQAAGCLNPRTTNLRQKPSERSVFRSLRSTRGRQALSRCRGGHAEKAGPARVKRRGCVIATPVPRVDILAAPSRA
jgi:hypothetical protein